MLLVDRDRYVLGNTVTVRAQLSDPRFDFSEGIPQEHRTLVVVPTMLSNAAAVEERLADLQAGVTGDS
jgi:hypothetical protein